MKKKRHDDDQVQKIEMRSPWELHTPRLNDDIYGEIQDDPETRRLADDIRHRRTLGRELSVGGSGLISPLNVTTEGVVISGNRRLFASMRAGCTTVPCIVHDVDEDSPDFALMLAEANEQRSKNAAQVAHECLVRHAPAEIEETIIDEQTKTVVRERGALRIGDPKRRKEIRENRELADAIIRVVCQCHRDGIRPTLRQVHYKLLNNPPLRNTKTRERYANTDNCYQTASDVAARLRLTGELPLDAIADATRPILRRETSANLGAFIEDQNERYLTGYVRDVTQSQDSFVLVLVEKQTQQALFFDHLYDHFPGVPLYVSRGQSSLTGAVDVVEAWKRSGKRKMIIIAMTDCDPSGEVICDAFGTKLVELGLCAGMDFDIIRAGLTFEQAERETGIMPTVLKSAESKKSKEFSARHGGRTYCYELEALEPKHLLEILDEALNQVLDVDRFNAEVRTWKTELVQLSALREEFFGIGRTSPTERAEGIGRTSPTDTTLTA